MSGCTSHMLRGINPSGPFHSVFTVTDSEVFATKLGNSTMQVRLTSDPIGQIGLAGSLVILTVGPGTVNEYSK